MPDDPEPPYQGAIVTVEPVPTGYRVRLDVPPGCELSRACHSKDEAWSVASALWSALRLPVNDLTDGQHARNAERPSENNRVRFEVRRDEKNRADRRNPC
jgi:hypothetical protein